MKNFALILIALVFCQFIYAQPTYFGSRAVNFKDESHKFSFPVFTKLSDKYSANKINQLLQISELEILRGFEADNIFEIVSNDDGRIYGGKVDIDFKVYDNNRKVLSLKLDEASCGATCTYWVRYYNFNSGNGDLIQLKDLFTEKGFERFFAFATKRRIGQLNREIQKLTLPERNDLEGISGSYEADDLTDFYIEKNVLYIDGENSFSKNQKFTSVEINRVSRFKLSEFKSYLNEYGKSLFGLTGKAIKKYRSKSFPQLYSGRIGKQKVFFVINKYYEDTLKAEYVYSEYGKGIFLEGEIIDNKIFLTEKLPKPRESGFIDYVDNGFIKAELAGQNILGTWTNPDNTKNYDLFLSRNK